MKAILIVLVTTFTASFALSRANAQAEEPKGSPAPRMIQVDDPRGPTTYLVQVDGATVAILPYNPKCMTSIRCSGDATYDKNTGVMNFTKEVELVSNVPDKAAIKISGDHLTLQPQK